MTTQTSEQLMSADGSMAFPVFKQVKLSSIKNAEYNPVRRVTGQRMKSLIASMSKIGLLYPIIIDPTNTIIDGHRRVAAARELGWQTIAARVVDREDRDQVYAEVNVTASRMTGNDALGVWLSCPAAVSDAQKRDFEAMEASLGRVLVKRIYNVGMSSRVWLTCRRIARHCERTNDTEFLKKAAVWLIDTAVVGQVMKSLEAGIHPSQLVKAINENKPLRQKWEAAD